MFLKAYAVTLVLIMFFSWAFVAIANKIAEIVNRVFTVIGFCFLYPKFPSKKNTSQLHKRVYFFTKKPQNYFEFEVLMFNTKKFIVFLKEYQIVKAYLFLHLVFRSFLRFLSFVFSCCTFRFLRCFHFV